MEPVIRYAKTTDGVNIAFQSVGEGTPFISMPMFPACHLQAIRQVTPARAFDAGVAAAGAMNVRYDPRGFGLSDRDVTSFTLDEMVEDLHAVIERLEQPRVILYGVAWACTIQLAYAARYPERVWRMVVQSGPARGADVYTDAFKSLISLASSNWEMFTNTIMSVALGWTREDDAGQWAFVTREAITPERFLEFMRDQHDWDATDLLGQIRAPTLVVHQRDYPLVSTDAVRRVVAGIPTAELVVMDGARAALDETGLSAMLAFLGADRGAQRVISGGVLVPAPTTAPSSTAVILFTDIVDSTALTERMGDAAFRERSRALDGAIRSIIRESGGATIDAKTLGDGVLATFASASQAVRAALALEAAAEASQLQLHVGLHAGDVIREENNVFGGAVNIAARISALSAPGEVLVSDIVRGLARTSAGVTFEDRGEHALKGVVDAQRVFAVRAAEAR